VAREVVEGTSLDDRHHRLGKRCRHLGIHELFRLDDAEKTSVLQRSGQRRIEVRGLEPLVVRD